MASIGNDERASSCVMSGHDRKTLSLSVFVVEGFIAAIDLHQRARWRSE